MTNERRLLEVLDEPDREQLTAHLRELLRGFERHQPTPPRSGQAQP